MIVTDCMRSVTLMGKALDDGLTRTQRYRLKDLPGYRERKRNYAKTPEQRAYRTEYMRGWRERNRERHNELARQGYARHRERIKSWQRQYRVWKTYGITLAEKDAIVEAQGGGCAICGASVASKERKTLHVDHDHETGVVRGVLCSRCNGSLGWFEKYREQIVAYLGGQGLVRWAHSA